MDVSEPTPLSTLLRRHRLNARFTQELLAERAGLSVRAIQSMERGESHPHQDTVQRLIWALSLAGAQKAAFEAAALPQPRRRGEAGAPSRDHHEDATTPTILTVPNNLPQQLTSFVGREEYVVELSHLLTTTRLLTLTGAGGSGKTRLALRVAGMFVQRLENGARHSTAEQGSAAGRGNRPMAPTFDDGVWLVELAALNDPILVPQAAASVLGVREEPGKSLITTLCQALRPRHLLMVLDNCEHLLEGCALLSEALLRNCPYLRLLVTSREALGIAGEVSRRVPSLPVPASIAPPAELVEYAGVRLFVDRALAVEPTFAVSTQNAGALVQVCRRLDGIPLGLELVAARVKGLTVEQLAARLDQRFWLFTGGSRTALPRQQTLRATIDWSYESLGEVDRQLFNQLSVFAGGWTLEAAEAVCADGGLDVLEVLLRLVDKSLVIADEATRGAVRYRMLETLRQYGRERLEAGDRAGESYDRHAAYYLELAQEMTAHPGDRQRLEGIRTEFDNLRAALAHVIMHKDVERSCRLASVLAKLWAHFGHLAEGRDRLAEVLALEGLHGELRGQILRHACWLAWGQGDYNTARKWWQEDRDIRRELGDRSAEAFSLNWLGVAARDQGDFTPARAALEESLAIYRELDERTGIADSLARLGSVSHATGDFAAARSLYQESLALRKELGDAMVVAWTQYSLALLALDSGAVGDASTLFAEITPLLRDTDDKNAIAHAVALSACLAAVTGDAERALRIGGALEAWLEVTTIQLALPYRDRLEGWLAAARDAAGTAAAEAWSAGRTMREDDIIAYVLAPLP